MSIRRKVNYVLGKCGTDAKGHHCHWPGCEAKVPPAMWGCKKHWFTLPKHLRDLIWVTYRPGQEETKTPSDDYIRVATEVQEWIRKHRGKWIIKNET